MHANRFIAEHRAQWDVEKMCRVLKMSRRGFYDWQKRPISPRCREDVATGCRGAARVHAGRGRMLRVSRSSRSEDSEWDAIPTHLCSKRCDVTSVSHQRAVPTVTPLHDGGWAPWVSLHRLGMEFAGSQIPTSWRPRQAIPTRPQSRASGPLVRAPCRSGISTSLSSLASS